MNHWLMRLQQLVESKQACVLITVAYTAGSTPREAGTKMIVTADEIYGTIGGGNLEYKTIETARCRLNDEAATGSSRFFDLYALGPMLEQCCGGVVFLHYETLVDARPDWLRLAAEIDNKGGTAVLVSRSGNEAIASSTTDKIVVTEFETYGSLGDKQLDQFSITRARQFLADDSSTSNALLYSLKETRISLPDISDALFFEAIRPSDFHVVLFGAGHVGRAIISTLAPAVACRITWIDNREDQFPHKIPGNVNIRKTSMPTNEIGGIPAGSFYLVMTHSHELDQAICEAILKRGDFSFLGLIGSKTKARRFVKRLKEKGITDKQLAGLTCPIGIPGIDSKEPGSIAVSVVAQLLQLYGLQNLKQTDMANVQSL